MRFSAISGLSAVFLSLLIPNALLAQEGDIGQFAIWKPNRGQESDFEAGYKQHLKWHDANKDTWNWYGWFVISGPRYGQFVDATFDHIWSDFDSPVKPAEDRADNLLNVFPFGELQTVFKVSKVKELSFADTTALKSRYLRLISLSVQDVSSASKLVGELRDIYQKRGFTKVFLTFNVVDGGDANQLIILLGFPSYSEYGKTQSLEEDISSIEKTLGITSIISIRLETLIFRSDMSLFAK